jgi:uncharacterized protein (TIGR00290 family)
MTPAPQRTLLSWSSGKDSAWSLHLLRQDPAFRVEALLTSFNEVAGRVAMHAVRRELVESQAERLGLPLWPVELPWPCSNAEYEKELGDACRRAMESGITAVAFGDLFLQDIRDYRERQMASIGLAPVFPVWKIPTHELAHELIAARVKSKITCIDLNRLDASYAGRDYDDEFLRSLPPGIDPCGENGEFHTFVYDAPEFRRPIEVRTGERFERDGFVFADILPV